MDVNLKGTFNWKPVGRKHEIKIGRMINEGPRSQIHEGVFGGKRRVAVKSMLFSGDTKEVEILSKLDHPNIIHIHFTDKKDTTLFIALDLCSYTLKQYVDDETVKNKINLHVIEVLRQMTDGLDYLHNGQKFCTVHRDLKPSNILFQYVEREEIYRVKISDFGISKEFHRGKTSTELDSKGTSGFVAPELLEREDGQPGPGKIRRATDIFSCGIIFYYVLSNGKHPFSNDMEDVNKKVRDAEPVLDDLEEPYSHEAQHLILSMIGKDYKKRVTISEVKAHHLFWDADTKISFLQKVSDFFENKVLHRKLLEEMEKSRKKVTGSHWKDLLCRGKPEVEKTITKKKGWEGRKSLQELLRLIRNWSHHYHDTQTTAELRDELGSYPKGFAEFFMSRVPKLLPFVYEFMRPKEDEELFQKYYDPKVMQRLERSSNMEEISGVIQESQSRMNEAIPMDTTLGSSCDSDMMEVDSSDEDIPEGLLDSSDEEEEKEKPVSKLVLREYQKELAEQALNGDNSLIIAPTGSGKTAVAYEIIKNHLESGKARSILFLVSKTTLARQQYEFFSKHLQGLLEEFDIAYLIGDITVDVAVGAIIKKMKLTILTPQILIDELDRHKSFVSFNDISMMIFDECHNTTKKHPYKVIMDKLLDFQQDCPTHLPIQIIGMTASPGVGKGKTREKVMENLITLLANLDVTLSPAVVVKNIEELKQHQNQIAESYVRVEIGTDRFSRKIKEAMILIEAQIEKKGMFGKEAGQVSKPPEDKDKQKYENWVMDLMNHVKVKIYDGKLARTVNLYASHLKMYHRLLYFKKLIPNAMNVTDGLAGFDQEGKQGEFLRALKFKLNEISKNAEIPMLEELFKIVQNEFGKNPECRCIIFVPRRQIAPAIVEAILQNEDLNHLKPKSLTGSNEHSEHGGMTKSEQDDAVQSFRDGKCKIMVATSVAEEGLDIRACNLVIMYSYVTGEVGRIQRKGRGRAENSKSILITPHGSEQVEREKMNAICAMATEYALRDLNNLRPDIRTQKIRDIQAQQHRERRNEYVREEMHLQEAKKWKILCGQCFSLVTTADRLRHIKNQHRFVVDEGFASRVTRNPCEPCPIAPGVPFEQVASFFCSSRLCAHFLGLEMQHKGKTYPTLSVKQLVFEDNNGNRAIGKQWSKCPFAVEKAVDDSEEEMDDQKVKEFAVSQSKSICKGFLAEDISEDDGKEAVDMANSA